MTVQEAFNAIYTTIIDNITTNGTGEITGEVHRNTLLEVFQGVQALLEAPDDYLLNQFPDWDEEFTYIGGQEYVVTYGGKIHTFVSESNSTGVVPGTIATVWAPLSALSLAHLQHTDKKLAEGTQYEVSAQEIREFLDNYEENEDLENYVRKDGSTPFTAAQSGVTPTEDAHLATKEYVDTSIPLPELVKSGLHFEFDHEDGLTPGSGEICFDVPLSGAWDSLDMSTVTEIYTNIEAVNNAGFSAFLGALYTAIHSVGGYLVVKWGPYGTALFSIDSSSGAGVATFQVTHLFNEGNFEMGEIDGTYDPEEVHRIGVTFILGQGSEVDLSDFVKKDGSTPFTAPQPGVAPTEDAHLVTKGYVDEMLPSNECSFQWVANDAVFPDRAVLIKNIGENDWLAFLQDFSSQANGTILRSTDNGLTWAVQNTFNTTLALEAIAHGQSNRFIGTLEGGFDIMIAVDGLGSSVNYLSPPTDHLIPVGMATNGAGVWISTSEYAIDSDIYVIKSTDNGDTWVQGQGISGKARLILSNDSTVFILFLENGDILKSTDSGSTFTTSDQFSGADFDAAATDGSGTWIVSSRTGNRLYLSNDNGDSWTAVSVPNTVDTYESTSIGTDGAGNWVFIIIQESSDDPQVYYSFDNGITWEEDSDTPADLKIYSSNSNRKFGVKVDFGSGVWVSGRNKGVRGQLSCPENVLSDGSVPFTSDQEIEGSDNGLILSSPDGTRWRIQVDNAGDLITTSL